MGRHSGYGDKTELDSLLRIDMTRLNQLGFLEGDVSRTMQWTNEFNEVIGRILLRVNLFTHQAQLKYTITEDLTQDKTEYNYRIILDSTRCELGGFRWWFICPLVVDGEYCGRRVRILYKKSGYFGCRTCQSLSYSAQNKSKRFRRMFYADDLAEKAEELYSTIKVPYYKGVPTRKMKRYLQLTQQFENYINQHSSFDDLF